jgi:hypothetical protein
MATQDLYLPLAGLTAPLPRQSGIYRTRKIPTVH